MSKKESDVITFLYLKNSRIKKCSKCGQLFRGSKGEKECLSCVMTEEDGIFFERDMGFGDR